MDRSRHGAGSLSRAAKWLREVEFRGVVQEQGSRSLRRYSSLAPYLFLKGILVDGGVFYGCLSSFAYQVRRYAAILGGRKGVEAAGFSPLFQYVKWGIFSFGHGASFYSLATAYGGSRGDASGDNFSASKFSCREGSLSLFRVRVGILGD